MQDKYSMHVNHCYLLTGTIPNMLMKKFVGGGDDWRIHMDVMVMVQTTTLTIAGFSKNWDVKVT
jgi:hypothetical protein